VREFLNRNLELWALIRRTDQPNTKLVVFVHGFRGDYLTTWGKLPSLLMGNADLNPPFDTWDFLFLGYPTRRMGTYLDITDLIGTAWRAAYKGEDQFTHKYQRLALFGHSLGTLGVRQLLCAWRPDLYGPLTVVHSVTLFGTPLSGSPWAPLAGLTGYTIAGALKESNPQLRMLRCWWDHSPVRRNWPRARLMLGTDDRVVGYQRRELVNWAGDAAPNLTNFDHSALVKPASWAASTIVPYIARGL
jgi:hypothetical protein